MRREESGCEGNRDTVENSILDINKAVESNSFSAQPSARQKKLVEQVLSKSR